MFIEDNTSKYFIEWSSFSSFSLLVKDKASLYFSLTPAIIMFPPYFLIVP